MKKFLLRLLLLAVVLLIFWFVSPWPASLGMRFLFNKGGRALNEKTEHLVPRDQVRTLSDISYDDKQPHLKLDIHLPTQDSGRLPVIVWIHGGAWLSGSKDQIANFASILASHDLAVVTFDYDLAPGAKYPTPLLQTNQVFQFIREHADKYRFNLNQIFIAGDSAGAQLAAQMGLSIYDDDYAAKIPLQQMIGKEQLKGLLLFCGAYNIDKKDLDGPLGGFFKYILWGYSGTRNFATANFFDPFRVEKHIDQSFPPSFISAGNKDPLLHYSLDLARTLQRKNLLVTTLFYPKDYTPPLSHEYQFDLTTQEGKKALQMALDFIHSNVP